ncbi:MAG: type II toxin-antitoxin system RelE/ParE family toxin [Streptococcaceae bacterium]|nr:type II toxin-antitoxin system RelE/ParE family toxin [Streptococcaceae bacterium]
MGYKIAPSKRVIKSIKKLSDKRLKAIISDIIFIEIPSDPFKGTAKHGDLAGIWTWQFKYQKTDYRIAYQINQDKIIPILLVGSHENFYDQLKRLNQ